MSGIIAPAVAPAVTAGASGLAAGSGTALAGGGAAVTGALSGLGSKLGPLLSNIGSIAAPILGGLLGGRESRAAQDEANRLYRQQLERLAAIGLPTEQEELYHYTPAMLPGLVGQYTPEMEQLYQLTGPSAIEQIQVDPRLQAAQMQALEQLGQISQSGLTPGDLAALEQIGRQARGAEQARQAQLQQEMAQRGIAGGGAELALRAASAQAAAARQQDLGLQQAQMAQQRQLQALGQTGAMAGQVRQQEFGEAERKASAADAIREFNLRQQQESAMRNLAARNQAAARTLAERQRIAESQADLMREMERRRAELPGQRFQREVQRAGGMAQAQAPMIQAIQTAGAQQAGLYGEGGKAIGEFLAKAPWNK